MQLEKRQVEHKGKDTYRMYNAGLKQVGLPVCVCKPWYSPFNYRLVWRIMAGKDFLDISLQSKLPVRDSTLRRH